MTTLAELVAATPAADRGAAVQLVDGPGVWRHVLELADPAAGSGVVWYDITERFAGYEYTHGAQQYQGRYRASVATVDLYAPGDDSLAPWNIDTSPTFGVNVSLGPGLLIRSGLIRVLDGAVVEWNPRFTCKVESWGDAAYAQGKVRQHRIVARDTLSSLVAVPLAANIEHNWSDRVYAILTGSGWAYGSLVYGAQFDSLGDPIVLLPARPAVSSAVNELDVTLDPAGLVWYTNRLGQLVIRPTVYDTFHAAAFAAGATGDQWPDDVVPCVFAWWACSEEAPTVAAYAVDGVNPFGLDRTETAVINHVKISDPVTAGFDDDDPVSIQRFDRHTFQASWIAANDTVAGDLLDFRANATVEALPLLTSVDLPGFHTGPDTVDYLDYVTIVHQNRDGGLQAFANGWLRYYREQVAPRGCDIDWALTITIDVANYTSTVGLLPVDDLTLVDVTDTEAEFSWTNPAQTVTPTHTQIRLINPASLWATVGYPIVGTIWGALEPSTGYEFQVRLIRVVDGLVTHVSPTRALAFVTDPTTKPDVDVDGDTTFPTPDDGCTLEWKLDESADGETWATVESGTVTEAPWEIPTPTFVWDAAHLYRICSREVCAGTPGPYTCSDLFVGLCSDPPALGVAPYSDPALVFYMPGICPTDVIVEAISEEPATRGPHFDTFATDGDGNVALVANGDGLVAYGVNPTPSFVPGLDGLTDDTTLTARLLVSTQPDAPLTVFGAVGLWIEVLADGALWKLRGKAHEAGAGITTITGTAGLAFGHWYDIALTHDVAAGDLVLYVSGVEQASALGIVGEHAKPGIYELGAPDNSLLTNCAVWSRVLTPAELPGAGGAVTVTINKAAGQADPAATAPILFTVLFSEAVTGFTSADVSLSSTAGTVSCSVTGSGPSYTVSVTGMTGAGAVSATIPAAVCFGDDSGLPNEASTSTDNSVAYAPGAPTANLFAHYDASVASSITSAATLVSQWNDLSGNARHLTQTVDATKPKTGTRTRNGLNVLDFDGGDHLARTAAIGYALTNVTIYVVAASDATTNFMGILSFHNGSGNDEGNTNALTINCGNATQFIDTWVANNQVALAGSGATPADVWTVRKNGNLTNGYQVTRGDNDASNIGTATSTGTANGGIVVGARYLSSAIAAPKLDGFVAEILIYSGTHDDATRAAVWSFLINKWGL